MTNMKLSLAAPFVLTIFLSGCGPDKDAGIFASSAQFVGGLKQVVAARRAGPPSKIQLTPEQTAKIDTPVLQVNPETFGGNDFLGRTSSRDDSGIGSVEVWKSSDNARIFLRNGVVIGTRGVGGDMLSANTNFTITGLSGTGKAIGLKTYIISDGDVTTTEYQFTCTISNLGTENINVLNQRYNTKKCVKIVLGERIVKSFCVTSIGFKNQEIWCASRASGLAQELAILNFCWSKTRQLCNNRQERAYLLQDSAQGYFVKK